MTKIYLDNNATTPLDPRVLQAMLKDLSGPPANPSSIHSFGREARACLTQARMAVSSFFSCKPEEILFTSGGTESLNMLLRGLGNQGHVISTSLEHSSVYRTLQALEKQGLQVTYLPVGPWGAPLVDDLLAALRPDTRALIFSAANGETGVKLDLHAIASLAEKRGIPLLLDAVAYIGKEPFSLLPGITALALSAHKFHGPKGVGALYLRSNLKLLPLLTGGNQEQMKRPGTENLAGILGLATALQIVQKEQSAITEQIQNLRDHFETSLLQEIPDLLIHGKGPRIANTSNIAFPGVDGETLLMQLDLAGIAASHGSACSAGALEPSRVLTQMGIDRKTARSSLRFSFSRMNTLEEIHLALEKIIPLVKALRKL